MTHAGNDALQAVVHGADRLHQQTRFVAAQRRDGDGQIALRDAVRHI
ncbi:hypothetical protein BN136_1917 [Cronobacter universalis NCTC 9529]|nr:hypothetical protein BN136_1917 [Cronobacter universalis NCTC 9529]